MTLPEVLALMLSLLGSDPADHAVLAERQAQPDVGPNTFWTALDVDGRKTALSIGIEGTKITYVSFLGEADPNVQVGTPTYRWTDARMSAEAWSKAAAEQADVSLVDVREDDWQVLFQDGPVPRLMGFGPSFPEGDWTDKTRAITVRLHTIEAEDVQDLIPE